MDITRVLPAELLCLVAEFLPREDLARFRRTCRSCAELLEAPLFRLHAFPVKPSQTAIRLDVGWGDTHRPSSAAGYLAYTDRKTAVVRAVEISDRKKPESLEMASSILEKVDRFCHPDAAMLNLLCMSDYFGPWFGVGTKLATALHEATARGLYDIVLWLLDRGADMDARMYDNGTPVPETALCLAIQRNRVPILRLLLDRGADVTVHYPFFTYNAGHYAMSFGTVEHLALLLERSDENKIEASELIDYYCENIGSDSPGMMALLLCQLRDRDENANRRYRLFFDLMRSGKPISSLEVLKTFSDDIPDRNLAEGEALTMLELSCKYHRKYSEGQQTAQLDILRLLLRHGVSITPAVSGAPFPDLIPPNDHPDERIGERDFAYAVCQVLLEHCKENEKALDPHDKDESCQEFLDAYKKAELTKTGVFAPPPSETPTQGFLSWKTVVTGIFRRTGH